MQPSAAAGKPRRGLAIAAALLGLFNLLHLCWSLWDYVEASPCGNPRYYSDFSVLAVILGLTAWSKAKPTGLVPIAKETVPSRCYGGRGLAIFGIIASTPAFWLSMVDLKSCEPHGHQKLGREAAAIKTLGTIHITQEQYQARNGRFAMLRELAEAGLIDVKYAKGGPVAGYVYSSSDVSASTHCVHADRANVRCSYRDFIICEDGVIRFIEAKTKGTVRRGEGVPVFGAEINDLTPTPTP